MSYERTLLSNALDKVQSLQASIHVRDRTIGEQRREIAELRRRLHEINLSSAVNKTAACPGCPPQTLATDAGDPNLTVEAVASAIRNQLDGMSRS